MIYSGKLKPGLLFLEVEGKAIFQKKIQSSIGGGVYLLRGGSVLLSRSVVPSSLGSPKYYCKRRWGVRLGLKFRGR